MYIQKAGRPSQALTSNSRFITFQIRQWPGLVAVALILTFAGTTQAAPFAIGLAIENDMDSNGNITVINGSKVMVAYEVDDPDKFLNKKDEIQLLRVSDDSVVSSVARGKKTSGTVSLKVRNSEGEQLYVGYVLKGQTAPAATTSHPGDGGFIPLMSIANMSLNELIIDTAATNEAYDSRIAELEAAPPPYQPAHYSEFFVIGQVPSSSDCANYTAYRASLVPSHYTCVQFLGSAGKGATSCDSTAVPELATALQNGTTAVVSIDGTDWRVQNDVGEDIWFGLAVNLGSCLGPAVLRTCIGNSNWGGIGTSTCSPQSGNQSLGIVFR